MLNQIAVETGPGLLLTQSETVSRAMRAAADAEHFFLEVCPADMAELETRTSTRLLILDCENPEIWLETLRQTANWRRIPKIVWLAREQRTRVKACYAAGSSCCLIRPESDSELLAMAQRTLRFWADQVLLPEPVCL